MIQSEKKPLKMLKLRELLVFVAFFIHGINSYVKVSEEVRVAFGSFIDQFNKTYPNGAAKEKALINFNIEFLNIKDHNAQFKARNISFGRRINQFSDETLDQKLNNLGGLRRSRKRD